MELVGRIALVTGASRGIGLATARELAAAGAHVVLAARSIEKCEAAAADITAGGSARAAAVDVTDYGQVDMVVREIAGREGRIDIVVNNAGVVGPLAPIVESDPEIRARTIATNLTGVDNVSRAAIDLVPRGGDFINICSSAADDAIEAMSAYCASKAVLELLTKAMALGFVDRGIDVLGFRPGRVDTYAGRQYFSDGRGIAGRLDHHVIIVGKFLSGELLKLVAQHLNPAELDDLVVKQ